MDDGPEPADGEPQDYEPQDDEPQDYGPPDDEPQDDEPQDYGPPDDEPQDDEPQDDGPPDDEPDPADYEPPSYEPDEHDHDDNGPDWSDEINFEFYKQQIYEDAVKQFTGERLQSYYLAEPKLGEPAWDSLSYAQALLPKQPLAALVFATTAMELAIKVVLIKPIVSGLVLTEGLAGFITDLTTQHTGMDRFQDLLAEILAKFGGVDLKTYTRPNSKRTLWQEIGEVQKARNKVIHRGERVKDSMAHLAVAVAATLLRRIFPIILGNLGLHLHSPITICGADHPEIPDDAVRAEP
jgi:hypothetical protein